MGMEAACRALMMEAKEEGRSESSPAVQKIWGGWSKVGTEDRKCEDLL